MTTQPKNLRAIAEFLVVAARTLAFALTAVGICASLLDKTTRPTATSYPTGPQDIS